MPFGSLPLPLLLSKTALGVCAAPRVAAYRHTDAVDSDSGSSSDDGWEILPRGHSHSQDSQRDEPRTA